MASTKRDRYEGETKDGKKHGQGTLLYPNGDKYQGAWQNDLREGYGVHTWPNGNRYEGHWEKSRRNGQGTFRYADGGSYTGGWKDGKRHGLGVNKWADGKQLQAWWIDNQPYDLGIFGHADRNKIDTRTGAMKNSNPPVCQAVQLARQFVKLLKWPEILFDSANDNCYCNRCYRADWSDVLAAGGGKYVVPRGCVRFGLCVDTVFSKTHDIWNKWIVTFHGTTQIAAQSILQTRQFCIPGDRLIDGTVLGIRDGHIPDQRYIFTSPTIAYSGSTIYSPTYTFRSDEDHKKYQAQLILQCRQMPNTFKVQGETIGHGKRPICPFISNEEIEYYTDRRSSLVAYGLLVRVKE